MKNICAFCCKSSNRTYIFEKSLFNENAHSIEDILGVQETDYLTESYDDK